MTIRIIGKKKVKKTAVRRRINDRQPALVSAPTRPIRLTPSHPPARYQTRRNRSARFPTLPVREPIGSLPLGRVGQGEIDVLEVRFGPREFGVLDSAGLEIVDDGSDRGRIDVADDDRAIGASTPAALRAFDRILEVREGLRIGRRFDREPARAAVFPDEVFGRALRDDRAVGEQADAVGEPLGFGHIVGGQDDGRPARGEVLDQSPDGTAAGGVDARRRLVEEEQTGVVDQRGADADAALLAAREILIPGVAGVDEADVREDVVGIPRVVIESRIVCEQFPRTEPARRRKLLW